MAWRLFDIVVSLIGLVLFGPIILVCAIATVLDSGLPPFNGTWRLGKHGKPFRCWKIRTLTIGHEAILEKHLAESEAARKEWHCYAKLIRDPRVTGVGRILRQTSLDELPQLWNVLRGDMALFSPPPLFFGGGRVWGGDVVVLGWGFFLEGERVLLGVLAHDLLAVKPGAISYYTAHGRSRLTVDERARLDSKFARRIHKLNVKWYALSRTAWHLLKRTGAH